MPMHNLVCNSVWLVMLMACGTINNGAFSDVLYKWITSLNRCHIWKMHKSSINATAMISVENPTLNSYCRLKHKKAELNVTYSNDFRIFALS